MLTHQTILQPRGLALALILTLSFANSAALVDVDSLPDPTLPYHTATVETAVNTGLSGIYLQSILVSDQRKSAVINGYVKTVGSWVNGGKIIDIQHDAVVIQHQGKKYTMYLNKVNAVKKR